MPSRSNIEAILALVESEVAGARRELPALSLSALDAVVRDIEGDVERLRGELDELLREQERRKG